MGKRLVIVGCGAAGASVVAEAKRRDPALSITMVEKTDYISTSACPMPYYISDAIREARDLIARPPEKFRESGVDVRIGTAVEEIDPEKGVVHLALGAPLTYDILALGTGTTALRPGIPGEDHEGVFVLKALDDGIAIKGFLQKNPCRKAVIVGAGFTGLEMCEALRTRGVEVAAVYLEERPAVHWDAELTNVLVSAGRERGVDFIPRARVLSIEPGSAFRLRLETDQGPVEGDMILLAVGIKPEVTLARRMGLTLGRTGAITVDFSQRTSAEAVYAVGDCAESFHRISRRWVHMPLGDIANKQGRVAGSNIGGTPRTFPGIVGAQAFRFFHLEVAATGLDDREALACGYAPVSATIWGLSAVKAMPEARQIGLRLTGDRATGKLLGAQAIGETGAVSRINTLSMALWAELSVSELTSIDLAYAPPFSGAWDAVHIAARELLSKM